MNGAQRIYFYAVLAATAFGATFGAAELAGTVIDSVWPGRALAGTPASGVALGIALLLVAGPVWSLHWRYVEKKGRQLPAEAAGGMRQAYLALVLAVALGFAGHGFATVLAGLSGGETSFSGATISRIVVWGLLWLFHWRVARRTWTPAHPGRSWHRWYLYAAAAGTLAVASIGLARLAGAWVSLLFDSISPGEVLVQGAAWSQSQQSALGAFLAGLTMWAAHWRRGAAGDRGSVLREVYVAGATTAATAAVAVAGAAILQALFRLAMGDTGEAAAVRMGRVSGWTGFLIVALPVWIYYGAILLRPGRSPEPSYSTPAARWSYRYAAMAMGLAMLVASAVVLTATLGGLLVPEEDVLAEGAGAVRDALATSLSLAVLGAGLWGYVRGRTSGAGEQDRRPAMERLYLFGVTGAALLAAVGGGTTLLYFIVRDSLAGGLDTGTLDAGRWAAGVFISTAAAAFVHARAVRRLPKETAGPAAPQHRLMTLIAPAGSEAIRDALQLALGQEVRWRVDLSQVLEAGAVSVGEAEIADVVDRAKAAPGAAVIVMWTPGGLGLASHD